MPTTRDEGNVGHVLPGDVFKRIELLELAPHTVEAVAAGIEIAAELPRLAALRKGDAGVARCESTSVQKFRQQKARRPSAEDRHLRVDVITPV